MLYCSLRQKQEDGYEWKEKDPQRRVQGGGGDGGVAGSQDGQRAGSEKKRGQVDFKLTFQPRMNTNVH